MSQESRRCERHYLRSGPKQSAFPKSSGLGVDCSCAGFVHETAFSTGVQPRSTGATSSLARIGGISSVKMLAITCLVDRGVLPLLSQIFAPVRSFRRSVTSEPGKI